MAREGFNEKRLRSTAALDALALEFPDARIALAHRTPLELLVAVMLSAQCSDARVNQVTPALFARCPTAADYAGAPLHELEGLLRSLGLFRAKARNLQAAAARLVADFGGTVPTDRAALARLPGVGNKTAGVVSMHLGGTRAFPVDTHIFRLAHRLDLSRARTPDGVEQELQALVPESRWLLAHQLLIWHGRRTCLARRPACDRCRLAGLCPKRGVGREPVRGGLRPTRRARS